MRRANDTSMYTPDIGKQKFLEYKQKKFIKTNKRYNNYKRNSIGDSHQSKQEYSKLTERLLRSIEILAINEDVKQIENPMINNICQNIQNQE